MFKRLLIALIFSLFLIPLVAQVSFVSAADAPVTSPITAPVVFNLTGTVTYHRLGRLMNNMSRFFPAENVMVVVTGFFDHSKHYTTTTDANGNYGVQVPAGLYDVRVSDNMGTFFTPPFRVENITSNNHRIANFQGLLFSF